MEGTTEVVSIAEAMRGFGRRESRSCDTMLVGNDEVDESEAVLVRSLE